MTEPARAHVELAVFGMADLVPQGAAALTQPGIEFDKGTEAMSGRLDPDAPTAVLHVLLHAPLLPARRDVAEVRVVQVVRAHHREARVDSAALALVDLVDGGKPRCFRPPHEDADKST